MCLILHEQLRIVGNCIALSCTKRYSVVQLKSKPQICWDSFPPLKPLGTHKHLPWPVTFLRITKAPKQDTNSSLLQPLLELRAQWRNAINSTLDTPHESQSTYRTWTESNPQKQIRICCPQDEVHFLSSKIFLLSPSVSIYNSNSSFRKFTLGKMLMLCKRFSYFIDETDLSSHSTHADWEVLWKHALAKAKQPPPNYYLHSEKHLYKLQMFCTQNRLESDCKHLLFSQCTDPLAPWLHIFATPTAFNLTLRQWWVCKSAIHHLKLYLPPSCTRPAKAPKKMTNIWHGETYQY